MRCEARRRKIPIVLARGRCGISVLSATLPAAAEARQRPRCGRALLSPFPACLPLCGESCPSPLTTPFPFRPSSVSRPPSPAITVRHADKLPTIHTHELSSPYRRLALFSHAIVFSSQPLARSILPVLVVVSRSRAARLGWLFLFVRHQHAHPTPCTFCWKSSGDLVRSRCMHTPSSPCLSTLWYSCCRAGRLYCVRFTFSATFSSANLLRRHKHHRYAVSCGMHTPTPSAFLCACRTFSACYFLLGEPFLPFPPFFRLCRCARLLSLDGFTE